MQTPPADTLPEFIERESYEKGFTQFYNDSIKPQLTEIEAKRLELRVKHKKRVAIAIPIAILLFVAGLILDVKFPPDEGSWTEGALVLAFLVGGWAYAPVIKYRSHVKNKILPTICSFFGILSYTEQGTQPRYEIEKAGIFPKFATMHSEDLIRGTYEGVNLEMQEIILKSGGKNKTKVFRGVIFTAEFNKQFAGRTYVKKDQGKFSNWLASVGNDLERVALEDPEFEKLFEVYSTNQIEARFILTTSFMERLKKLSERNVSVNKTQRIGLSDHIGSLIMEQSFAKQKQIYGVKCSFVENKMYISINMSYNLFEAQSINRSILDVEDIHTFLAQMNSFFEIIKILKLNEKITLQA